MNWINEIKDSLPEYAKDTKLNLVSVMTMSTLDATLAQGCALAAAFAAGNTKLINVINSEFGNANRVEADAALSAASLMAQNNIWYPYVEMASDPNLSGLGAGLRMFSMVSRGGTTKIYFEACTLAASIVGKCNACVRAHYDSLKKEGMTVEQLRDIGRLAAVINSVSRVLNAQ